MSWSDIFIPSSNQTSDEGEANLARQRQQYQDRLNARIDAGTIDPDVAARDQAYVDGVALDNQDAAASAGFKEGLSDGLANIKSALANALSIIPWQGWVIGIAALFLYLGGFSLLKRLFKK